MAGWSEEGKWLELKKMVIRWKLWEEISDGDWWEYWRSNDAEWIEQEGLKILLSDEVMEMIKNRREEEVWDIFRCRHFSFITVSSVSSRSVQHSLVQLCTSMGNRVDSGREQWNRHRVMCWVVKWMMGWCKDGWSDETYDSFANYLRKIIEQCENVEMVKWIILTFEEWWLKTTFHSLTKCQLVSALRTHALYLAQVNITSDFEHVDLGRYQVGWCAQWAIDNVLGDGAEWKRMPLVKLSSDQCEVRIDAYNDWHSSISVRSSFAVTSGVYYYEVIPLSDGKMRFGWSTSEMEVNNGMQIGDDQHSIGLEVGMSQCCIYHNNKRTSIPISYQPFSVIGTLIDVDKRQFAFYLTEGKNEWHGMHFSSLPYYPTASLSSNQHCIFNFGQVPFKFNPRGIILSTNFNQTNGKYQLTETCVYPQHYNFGFDGSKEREIYRQESDFCDNSFIPNFTYKPRLSIGNVIRCLAGCDKILKFYKKGKLIKSKENERLEHFSTQPSAEVGLSPHQHCYLNMGQCPFRHPPSVPFRTFHHISPTPPSTQILANDRAKLMFDDEKQKRSDRLANEIVENISNNSIFTINLKTSVDRLRLLQSLISVSGPSLLDSCHSVHASWISQHITQSTSDNPAFPELVAQLLYPYFTLHLTDQTATKHRNVCIILASLIPIMKFFPIRVTLYQQLLTYLTQIVTNFNLVKDELLLTFALISLENMELTENDKESLKADEKFCQILEAQSYSAYHTQLDKCDTSKLILHQSKLCTCWFLDHVLNSTLVQQSHDSNIRATLNPLDRSSHLKLSSDLLTARSDRHWQSVRSICSADKNVYFEATLHSSGSMRIGCAYKRTNLIQGPIGIDHTSIGYDGYNQCIWHNNKRIKRIKTIPRWKCGDIVGCLIDVDSHSFSFYLNCQLVYMHTLGFFSKLHHYYATVSLHTFQQCRFNFGPTQLPPPIDYYTFNSILNLSCCSIANTIGNRNRIFNPITGQNSATNQQRYNLTKKPHERYRGVVLVLSYEEFYDTNYNRPGNSADVDKIISTFIAQGFEVIVENDKTKNETWDIVKKESKNPKYKDYSCFIMVILSHGIENEFLCADGLYMEYRSIFDLFQDCPFVGKPKLYFIQACQGSEYDHGLEKALKDDGVLEAMESDTNMRVSVKPNANIHPKYADTLEFYCSYSGFISFRSPMSGSWFIQTLCQMLRQYVGEELQCILQRVIDAVSSREGNDEVGRFYKQLPVIQRNTLRKQFYF